MLLGFDKFDGHYVKVIGDFGIKMSTIYFDFARIQKVDDDFYWLLCFATTVANVEFKYKPTEQRFPGFVALLLKKAPYDMNIKTDDKWDKITAHPTAMEKWLIDHFEYHKDMFFNPTIPFSGFINLSAMTFDSLPVKGVDCPINSTGIMNVSHANGGSMSELPDCELKKAGSKGSGNSYKKKAPVEINAESLTQLYWLSMLDADATFLALQQKNPFQLTEKDRDNLRLGLFLHRLNGK